MSHRQIMLDPNTAKAAKQQFRLAMGPQMLTCECGRQIPIRFMFRCFYCRLWFCEACAEIHFGKSRAEYFAGASVSREKGEGGG